MKHRGLVLILSIALILTMAIPGVLAVSADKDGTESNMSVDSVNAAYEKLMACESLGEIESVIAEIDDETASLFTEEQISSVEAKIEALLSESSTTYAASEDEQSENDEVVQSVTVQPTVNYTNVAPFVEPVTGEEN